MIDLQQCFTLPEHLAAPKFLQSLQDTLLKHATEAQLLNLSESLKGEKLKQFQTVLIGSEFSARLLCENPSWIESLLDSDTTKASDTDNYQRLSQHLEADPNEWDRELRRVRNYAMVRIIWRDFNRITDTPSTTYELTRLAETTVQVTLEYHYQRLCNELGTPRDRKGHAQPMLVIGMGKLGAWELNLSSDIDLIFAYPHNGETEGGRSPLTNQEFFSRLGQRIIKSLDTATRHGFVFRVDMRLRPYGQSGALVHNFNALEDYYQTQGREWERFAMIKARVIASNGYEKHTTQLMGILRSFTYRRYIDFSAIDALRNLKQLINREVARRGQHDNVKLGRGGIRELEFIVQAFQIIRGGRDIELQDRRLLHALPLLCQLNCLPPGTDKTLGEAYCFLRDVEHGIQGFQDRQTQELPQDERGQSRLAHVLGFEDWPSFQSALEQHRRHVHEQFQEVIAAPDEDSDDETQQALEEWRGLWLQLPDPSSDFVTALEDFGFDQPERAERLLVDLLKAPAVVAMHAMGRERLDDLMPRLLYHLSQSDAATETLARLIKLLLSVARRSVYLLLLIENPRALNQLVTLSQASPWIADRLAEHPALLDELLNPDMLYSVPDKMDLAQTLRQQVLRIPSEDLEGQMEALRYFRSAQALQAAACEITGQLPLMKVSDYLTQLAEVILQYVLDLSWQRLVARHGYPDGIVTEAPNFAIIGYGKLGGIELSHGSDLDLVFIHDANPTGQTSGDYEGKRVLDNITFYMRLGQKIIHFLNTQTLSGQVYEVDMRLRPSGNSGLLVSSFSAYRKYQHESAWTWEHQALVRARPIAGNSDLAEQFDQLRREVLAQERPQDQLRKDVLEMRAKMRGKLGSSSKDQAAGRFHLKQDAGGIVDIEFMVQYAVLAWSHNNLELTRYTDNIRILGCLQEFGQLGTQEVQQLIEAYKAFRSIDHRLALQQQPSIVDGKQWETERQNVTRIWHKLFDSI